MPGSVGRIVRKPKRTKELSEFLGIMIGDGGMSPYQATISLHHIDDREYAEHVAKMTRRLFGYTPSMRHRKCTSVLVIVMSRVNLVRHLHSLGLPVGDKIRNGLDIPQWIKVREDYLISCIRGLIDTDGSVFTHSYMSKGKRYSYKKLSFTSASPHLLQSVATGLAKMGMRPRMGSNHDVRLDSVVDMQRYFSLIGSHNPKHLRRYAS